MKNEKLSLIYKELFGPVILYYLKQLDSNIRYLDDGNTKFLFTTRAGIRIKELYQLFLQQQKLTTPQNMEIFLASRFLVAKSHLVTNNEHVKALFSEEYQYRSVNDLIKGLALQDNTVDVGTWQIEGNEKKAKSFIKNQEYEKCPEMRAYLKKENRKFKEYFSQLMGKCTRAVIIDTGWKGTIQSLMHRLYPEIDFLGLYLGKIIDKSADPVVNANSLGLLFESQIAATFNSYIPELPETAFTCHRHILESMFEPNARTVEYIRQNKQSQFVASDHDNLINEICKWSTDALYMSVREYVSESTVIAFSELHKAYRKAMKAVERKIIFPVESDLELLGEMYRSADFGKNDGMSALLPKKDRFNGDSPKQRIQDSLWSQGQVIVEYRHATPERIRAEQEKSIQKPEKRASGTVAIITRTMDRPILLERAAESVATQTYKNYTWVVINDGGEKAPVDEVVKKSLVDPRKIIVVHNEQNLGMEASSNKAIASCDSDYVIIHDDDDSWAPQFLEKSTSFLESTKGKKYGAVLAGTWYVSESIIDDEIIIHGKWPYNEWLKNIHLAEMAHSNTFAPIAFLFKRTLYNKIGGYDESLPVLGDWDFNLRFLMEADIGVLDEKLAFYHHRDKAKAGSIYSNSVIGGTNKHLEYNSIVRNKYLRPTDDTSKSTTLAVLNAMGYMEHDFRVKIGTITSEVINKVGSDISPLVSHEVRTILAKEIRPMIQHELSSVLMAQWTHLSANMEQIQHIQYLEYVDWAKKNGVVGEAKFVQKLARLFKKKKKYPPNFDEKAYLRNNPDVKTAVKEKQFQSGFQHYVMLGYKEKRKCY